jgi:hypothetical protein
MLSIHWKGYRFVAWIGQTLHWIAYCCGSGEMAKCDRPVTLSHRFSSIRCQR